MGLPVSHLIRYDERDLLRMMKNTTITSKISRVLDPCQEPETKTLYISYDTQPEYPRIGEAMSPEELALRGVCV